MAIPKRMLESLNYSEKHPKSLCTCSHLGDGNNSEHAGILGHGGCKVPGCYCIQFSWKAWNLAYKEHMARHGFSF